MRMIRLSTGTQTKPGWDKGTQKNIPRTEHTSMLIPHMLETILRVVNRATKIQAHLTHRPCLGSHKRIEASLEPEAISARCGCQSTHFTSLWWPKKVCSGLSRPAAHICTRPSSLRGQATEQNILRSSAGNRGALQKQGQPACSIQRRSKASCEKCMVRLTRKRLVWSPVVRTSNPALHQRELPWSLRRCGTLRHNTESTRAGLRRPGCCRDASRLWL